MLCVFYIVTKTYCKMIAVHCFIFALLGCLVASQEKVCSSFCSSLGMLESNPGNLVMTFIRSTRLVEECQMTTGSKLLLVCTKPTVTWN